MTSGVGAFDDGWVAGDAELLAERMRTIDSSTMASGAR